MVSFADLMYPQITRERFIALREASVKRICFGSTHINALKPNAKGTAIGFLNIPFSETIKAVFPWAIFPSKGQFGGFYRLVPDKIEYDQIAEWMSERKDLVFIRSLFDSAVAACEHYQSSKARSAVGELEYSAKFGGSSGARDKLIDVLESAYSRTQSGLNINGIVSVPPSTAGSVSLPNYLAAKLSERLGITDYTSSVAWSGSKPSIKAVAAADKWDTLAAVGMTVSPSVSGKTLLLVDDMYQSGATAHYVASQLRIAGTHGLHLLAVSKGRRDTDNQ